MNFPKINEAYPAPRFKAVAITANRVDDYWLINVTYSRLELEVRPLKLWTINRVLRFFGFVLVVQMDTEGESETLFWVERYSTYTKRIGYRMEKQRKAKLQ